MQRPGGAMGEDLRRFGLCGGCSHGETLDSRTGSRFLLCTRARQDPRYARYPPVPVYACAGFTPRGAAAPSPPDGGPGPAPGG